MTPTPHPDLEALDEFLAAKFRKHHKIEFAHEIDWAARIRDLEAENERLREAGRALLEKGKG